MTRRAVINLAHSLPRRMAVLAMVGAIGLMLLVSVIAVGGARTVLDSCAEPDHPPFARLYLGDGLSFFNVAVSFQPAYDPGTELTGVLDHNGQETVQDATADSLGRVFFNFGIFEYGPYAWSVYDGPTTAVPVASGTALVGPDEPPCDPSQLQLAAVESVAPTATVAASATTSPTSGLTASPSPTSTPSPAASPASDGTTTGTTGLPWWLLIPPGLIGAAIGLWILTRKGPCDDLSETWLRARNACDDARRRAAEARAEAERAEAERDRIKAELDAIRRAFPSAGRPGGDRSWAESEGRRTTQRDLDMQKAAARQAWNRYRSDPNPASAQKLQEEWGDLDSEAAREELRRLDEQAQQLENELGQAQTAADVARANADEAQAAADRICAEADAARSAWDECVREASEPPSAPPTPPTPAGPPAGATTTGPGTGASTTGGSPAAAAGGGQEPPPSSHHDDEDGHHSCCSSGIWAGYGFTTGGILAVVGYESIVCELFCTSHPEHRVSVKAQFLRVGIGLGGEAAGTAIVLWGQDHGDKAAAALGGVLTGLDGDFSVGIPFAKAAKAGKKGLEVHRLLKNFEKLRKVAGAVSKEATKELVEGAVKGVGRSVGGQAGSNAIQGEEELAPGGTVIPIGAGLQAGVWWKPGRFSKLEIISMDCCSCMFP